MPRPRKNHDSKANSSDEPIISSQPESETEANDEEEATSSSSSDEEMPELMVTSRSRRSNAGNKMAELLTKAETDEFYKSTYGGFHEVSISSGVHNGTGES